MGTRLRSLDSADGRRGLLEWAEPVIYDRLRDAYQRRLGAGADALRLARLHCRVWRALIAGDEANYEGLRTELIAAVDAQRPRSRVPGAAATPRRWPNCSTSSSTRFQRSERQASSYRLALFELAERLVARGEVA